MLWTVRTHKYQKLDSSPQSGDPFRDRPQLDDLPQLQDLRKYETEKAASAKKIADITEECAFLTTLRAHLDRLQVVAEDTLEYELELKDAKKLIARWKPVWKARNSPILSTTEIIESNIIQAHPDGGLRSEAACRGRDEEQEAEYGGSEAAATERIKFSSKGGLGEAKDQGV